MRVNQGVTGSGYVSYDKLVYAHLVDIMAKSLVELKYIHNVISERSKACLEHIWERFYG